MKKRVTLELPDGPMRLTYGDSGELFGSPEAIMQEIAKAVGSGQTVTVSLDLTEIIAGMAAHNRRAVKR